MKTTIDGIAFDSKAEAAYYAELKIREKLGEVRNIRRQVRFPLKVDGEKICDYIADFVFQENPIYGECGDVQHTADGWHIRIVDVKSEATRKLPVYRIKAKWMAANGNPVVEVLRSRR